VLRNYYSHSEKKIAHLTRTAVKKIKLRNSAFCHTVELCVRPMYDFVDQDSVVRMATRYRLNKPGIESRSGEGGFLAPVQTGTGACPASFTIGIGDKAPTAWF
jgi:hypothetical protein